MAQCTPYKHAHVLRYCVRLLFTPNSSSTMSDAFPVTEAQIVGLFSECIAYGTPITSIKYMVVLTAVQVYTSSAWHSAYRCFCAMATTSSSSAERTSSGVCSSQLWRWLSLEHLTVSTQLPCLRTHRLTNCLSGLRPNAQY